MLPPPHPIDCIPFLVTSAVRAVSIKRRLGEPSKQHRGLKKLLANVKRPPNNAGHPPFFRLDALPHGWLQVRERHSPKAIHTPPFPYLAIKRLKTPTASIAAPPDVFPRYSGHLPSPKRHRIFPSFSNSFTFLKIVLRST